MARGDKTGPMGAGPMTGRAMGYCVGNEAPGFAWGGGGGGGRRRGGGGGGFGRGMGRGRGMAWRHGSGGWAAGAPTLAEPGVNEERETLNARLRSLEAQGRRVKARLEALESDNGESEG